MRGRWGAALWEFLSRLPEGAMKPVGIIGAAAGGLIFVLALIVFFGRVSIAEGLLGAKILWGQPYKGEEWKLTLVTVVGVLMGFVGFVVGVAGAVMIAIDYYRKSQAASKLARGDGLPVPHEGDSGLPGGPRRGDQHRP